MKKSILPAVPVLTLILLLSHPAVSFDGAKSGLLLWFNVVLPTLLPFMLCSSLLVAWGGVPLLVRPFYPLLRLLGLSREGSYALIAGLLCGYPMGAKTTADFLRERSITPQEGKLLLAVCGCPSPMFVAGYIRSHLNPAVPAPAVVAALYLPLLLIAVLAAVFYRTRRLPGGRCAGNPPLQGNSASRLEEPAPDGPAAVPPPGVSLKTGSKTNFDEILMNALEIMVKIGGYIMLYSILAAFLSSAAWMPDQLKPLFLGLVEMTTGIEAISRMMTGWPAAAAIAASAAFGGLSGVSQTNTVIKNAGLSIRHYILWKLIHASLTYATLILLSSL